MFMKTNDIKIYKKLLSYGAKEIKQNSDGFYTFLYDKDILDRYNDRCNQGGIFLTDRMYFA